MAAKTDRYQIGVAANPIFLTQPDTPDGSLELRSGDASTPGTLIRRIDTPISAGAVALTSGTFKDFVIPSWAKRIVLTCAGMGSSGSGIPTVQLNGEITGYVSVLKQINSSNVPQALAGGVTGFDLNSGNATAARSNVILTLIRVGTSNTWVSRLAFTRYDVINSIDGVGSKTTSAAVTTLRLTTNGGTDTFTNGSASVLID